MFFQYFQQVMNKKNSKASQKSRLKTNGQFSLNMQKGHDDNSCARQFLDVKGYEEIQLTQEIELDIESAIHPLELGVQDRNVMSIEECSLWATVMTAGNYTAIRRPLGNFSTRYPLTASKEEHIGMYQRPNPNHPNRYESFKKGFLLKLSEIKKKFAGFESDRDVSIYVERIETLIEIINKDMLDGPKDGGSESLCLSHALRMISRHIGVYTTRYIVTELSPDFIFNYPDINSIDLEENDNQSIEETYLDYDVLHDIRTSIVKNISGTFIDEQAKSITISAPIEDYPCVILEMHEYIESLRESLIDELLIIHLPEIKSALIRKEAGKRAYTTDIDKGGRKSLIEDLVINIKSGLESGTETQFNKTLTSFLGEYARDITEQLTSSEIEPLALNHPDDAVMMLTQFFSAYLAGLVNRVCKKIMGADWIWTDYQPSFGSLRPTFSETGFSVRFSPGLVPEIYYDAFKIAVNQFQHELLKDDSKMLFKKIFMAAYFNKFSKKIKDTDFQNVLCFTQLLSSKGRGIKYFLEHVLLKTSSQDDYNFQKIVADVDSFYQKDNKYYKWYSSNVRPQLIQEMEHSQDSSLGVVTEQDITKHYLARIKYWLRKKIVEIRRVEQNKLPVELINLKNKLISAHNKFIKIKSNSRSWNESIFYIEQGMNILSLAYELSETINKLFKTNSKVEIFTDEDSDTSDSLNSILTQGTLSLSDDAPKRRCYTYNTLNGIQSYNMSVEILSRLAEKLGIEHFSVQQSEVYFEYSIKDSKLWNAPKLQVVETVDIINVDSERPVDILIADLSPFPQSQPGDKQVNIMDRFLAGALSPAIIVIDITSASQAKVKEITKKILKADNRIQNIILIASDNKYAQAGIDDRSRGEFRLVSIEGNKTIQLGNKNIESEELAECLKQALLESKSCYNKLYQARDRMFRDLGLRRTLKNQSTVNHLTFFNNMEQYATMETGLESLSMPDISDNIMLSDDLDVYNSQMPSLQNNPQYSYEYNLLMQTILTGESNDLKTLIPCFENINKEEWCQLLNLALQQMTMTQNDSPVRIIFKFLKRLNNSSLQNEILKSCSVELLQKSLNDFPDLCLPFIHLISGMEQASRHDFDLLLGSLSEITSDFEPALVTYQSVISYEQGTCNDRKLMSNAVSGINGFLLDYATNTLKEDFELVVCAIGQNPSAFYFASQKLQTSTELQRIADIKDYRERKIACDVLLKEFNNNKQPAKNPNLFFEEQNPYNAEDIQDLMNLKF